MLNPKIYKLSSLIKINLYFNQYHHLNLKLLKLKKNLKVKVKKQLCLYLKVLKVKFNLKNQQLVVKKHLLNLLVENQ